MPTAATPIAVISHFPAALHIRVYCVTSSSIYLLVNTNTGPGAAGKAPRDIRCKSTAMGLARTESNQVLRSTPYTPDRPRNLSRRGNRSKRALCNFWGDFVGGMVGGRERYTAIWGWHHHGPAAALSYIFACPQFVQRQNRTS